MNSQCECTYCGHKWKAWLAPYSRKNIKCPKCNDKEVKVREIKTGNVYGYLEDEK